MFYKCIYMHVSKYIDNYLKKHVPNCKSSARELIIWENSTTVKGTGWKDGGGGTPKSVSLNLYSENLH